MSLKGNSSDSNKRKRKKNMGKKLILAYQNPRFLLIEIGKLILTSIWSFRGPKIAKRILKKEK